MTTQKKKKSAKEKKVLIGSVAVAAAIVAGSTFAWFSSKDEVTNRLTASADYNVSIVEDFQPPKEWIPGQTVNKDVAAVNTGNVDAFVRMWLGGTMRILKEQTPNVSAKAQDPVAGVQKVDDVNKTKLGLNYYKDVSGTKVYFKTLSTEKINNPNDANHNTAEYSNGTSDVTGSGDNQQAGFSEVQSMQAAGVLVYAPADAHYTWELEQATDMWTKGTSTSPELVNIPKGTKVGSVGSGATYEITPSQSAMTGNYYGAIDASTFKPETTGLYLFRRNIGDTADGTANKYEYSGYYFVKGDSQAAVLKEDTYFALHTEEGMGANGHSDYVLPASYIDDNSDAVPSGDQVLPVTVEEAYLYTAAEEVLDTTHLTWTYDSTAGSEKFTVKNAADGNNISIDIALANIGSASDHWYAITDNTNAYKNTFYYTNDVEAGDTTRKLVDSVTLSDATKTGAYLALDFDLDVFMDSVQVTMDETGKEGYDTIKETWAASVTGDLNTGAKATSVTYSGTSEIDTISWAK